ncbi:unnamed protein product [Microthlaspi erraticum]|uniref:F-box domain-containing protein n=1 Tax=Microthlaspi erraticum TaxID=1685480 RepID=A0A6D2K886_9BRAS|nr:unnamed protein product [Microthlaspi erraticum]
MGHQEKRKRKGNRSRRTRRKQSKSASSFPVDLTSDILLRLPVKSIVRFRCVSKLWSSITTEPYFINLFNTRSSTKPTLLLCLNRGDDLLVSSIPQNTMESNEAYSSSLPIDRYHMKIKGKYSYLPPMESVHGLICFQEKNPIVWNPSMRKFLKLPHLHNSWEFGSFFLGYDPVEAQESSWRMVKTNQRHRARNYTCGKCINGVIYYLARDHSDCFLMSFDVRSEKFDMIKLPSEIDEYVLINYKGRLACVDDDNKKRLWILEDAEKHKWSSQDFLVPLRHLDESLATDFKLKGFTHAGEFIFEEPVSQKNKYILSCDTVRNSFRRFEFEGVRVGYKFWLRAFPNHIESLISL